MSENPTPLWRNRDYLLLWSGQAVSIVGTQVSQLAFPLLVLALTGSPARAGLVAAARSLPYLLLTLHAGALVDRWDRKLTMRLCSMGSALALASVAVAYALGTLTIAQIVVVSFVEGSFAVVFRLAETSALSRVVPREQLPSALAQQQLQYAAGHVVGPPLGGALFAASPVLPFVVDAASYAASSLSLAAVRARFQEASAGGARRSLRAEIGEGVAWLWRQPLIRYMACLTGGINFIGAGGTLIGIVLAAEAEASSFLTGVIFAAAGVGGIAGALVAPRLQRRLTFGQAIVGACWAFALARLLFASTTNPLALMILIACATFISPVYDIVQMSYRLALVPDALQGRVNSVYRLVADGAKALGAAATGILIEYVGVTGTIVVSAAILAALAALTTANRHIRAAPRLGGTNPARAHS